jgi:DNA-directed RNA polymerase specialized sigma subunit
MSTKRSSAAAVADRTETDRAVPAIPLSLNDADLAFYVRHHLSDEERLVVMLRYAEQLAFDEIAGIMTRTQHEIELLHQEIVDRLHHDLKPASDGPREVCAAGKR